MCSQLLNSLVFILILWFNKYSFDSNKCIGGTIGSSLFAVMQGVQILRVHETNEVIQSIKIFEKLLKN